VKRKATQSLGVVSSASVPVNIDQFDTALAFLRNTGATTATYHFEAGYERDGTQHWSRLSNFAHSLPGSATDVVPIGTSYDLTSNYIAFPMKFTPGKVRLVKDSGPDIEFSVVALRLSV